MRGSGWKRYREEFRPMLRLAWPVVLAELGWMTMGLVDAIMVGPLGEGAIGAVGLANSLFLAPSIFGIGLLFGLDTFVSHAHGAGQEQETRRWLEQGVILSLLLSPILMAIVAVTPSVSGVIGVTPDIQANVARYLRVAVWSVGPLLLFTALRRYLQAVGMVRPILFALISANLMNVIVNWLLIEGHWGAPALGVAGAAWATVMSRFTMLSLLIVVVWLRLRESGNLTASGPRWKFEASRLWRLVTLGFPAAVQVTLEVGVFALATILAGTLGRVALDAHQIALNYCSTMFMVPLGLSSAGAVRVGHALGRRDPSGAAAAGWTAISLGGGFMLVSALVMLAVPHWIIGAFTSQPTIHAAATSLLAVAAVFQVFDGLQVSASGSLRGAGDTRTSMRWNLLAHWAVGFPVGYLLAFYTRLGIIGLWVGLSAGLILAGIALVRAWSKRTSAFALGVLPNLPGHPEGIDFARPADAQSRAEPLNAVAVDAVDRPH